MLSSIKKEIIIKEYINKIKIHLIAILQISNIFFFLIAQTDYWLSTFHIRQPNKILLPPPPGRQWGISGDKLSSIPV